MRAYDRFAPHFDAWQNAFGGAYDDLILPRLLAALTRHAPRARRVVDLGIGTGDLVVALARRGFDVVGVDVSRPMLAVAREKIARAGLPAPPVLLEQDVRALALLPPADAALCVYTVVNQLTADGDLARLFAAVRGALVPAGLFAFETNLPAAYARWWSGDDEVRAGGVRIRRRHRRHARDGVIEAEIELVAADGAVEHDRILQRPYSDAELEHAIAAAGFELLERCVYDPFAPGDPPTKALWTARAPAQRLRA